VLGVAGGIVGLGAPQPFASHARSRASSAGRSRSAPQDAFSQPPNGALALAGTPADQRPLGLLGSVLRREAAIAAMKGMVQVPPPMPGRDRSKLLGQLGESLAEFRESTVDAIELLAERPPDAARFYWNGMDLALKMRTDMLWAPLPQSLDPLLYKWFAHWSDVWISPGAGKASGITDVLGAKPNLVARCRRAEALLRRLADGASSEGAGMGGWATLDVSEAAHTLWRVQVHRIEAPHSEGGAHHAQRRRWTNMELLLYARDRVHIRHLERLNELHIGLMVRSACLVQSMWRLTSHLKNLRHAAQIVLAKTAEQVEQRQLELQRRVKDKHGDALAPSPAAAAPPKVRKMATSPPNLMEPTSKPQLSAQRPQSAVKRAASVHSMSGSKENLVSSGAPAAGSKAPISLDGPMDRSFLSSMSVGLPDMV
jgi:hypothetical protein